MAVILCFAGVSSDGSCIPLKALPIAKVLFTLTGCLPGLKIITKSNKPDKELRTRTSRAVCAWCSVSRAASSASFTCSGSLGGRNRSRVGGLSTLRLAAGGTPPPALPLLSAEEKESFVSSPAFQPEGTRVLGGFLPCSLARLMGFMTPLLAPEDR